MIIINLTDCRQKPVVRSEKFLMFNTEAKIKNTIGIIFCMWGHKWTAAGSENPAGGLALLVLLRSHCNSTISVTVANNSADAFQYTPCLSLATNSNAGGLFHGSKVVKIMNRYCLSKGVSFNDFVNVPFECCEVIFLSFLNIFSGDWNFLNMPTFDIRIPTLTNQYDFSIGILTRF